MKAKYDLSKMKSRKNPRATELKKSVMMRLSEDVSVISRKLLKKRECLIRVLSICI